MRVAVITAWSDDHYNELAAISVPVMQRYCDRNGYTLIAERGYYINCEAESPLRHGDRCKAWLYKEVYDRFDLVMWLDVDTIVMNSEHRIENKIGLLQQFLWSYDCDGPNTSAMIMRTTPEVHNFLHTATHWGADHGKGDVTAMRHVGLWPPHSKIIDTISGREFGHTYIYAMKGWERYAFIGDYRPGDWLLEFPATPHDDRVRLMREYAAQSV